MSYNLSQTQSLEGLENTNINIDTITNSKNMMNSSLAKEIQHIEIEKLLK